jgi:hypothetical protein
MTRVVGCVWECTFEENTATTRKRVVKGSAGTVVLLCNHLTRRVVCVTNDDDVGIDAAAVISQTYGE